jgi:hypothetical protein
MQTRREIVAGALGLALTLGGCGDAVLDVAGGGLRLGVERLEFPRTFVGHPTRRTLLVENDGRAPLEAKVSVAAPFATDHARRTVPPGVTSWELRFDPPTPGTFETKLEAEVRGERHTVLLVGAAEAVPACVPSRPCVSSTFDAVVGRCVESGAADGTRCEEECIEDARCVAGACLGRARGCDDGNACTRDACEPGRGCVHRDTASTCPALSEQCQAAFCDPTSGCGVAPVVDGTACGPSDCATTHVCLAGRCAAASTPDGAPCGAGSPCQDAGTCRAGTCEQPPPRVLTPSWRVESKARLSLVADDDGHLYWLQYEPLQGWPYASLWLISATRTGLRRFAVELGTIEQCPGPRADWSGNLVVVGAHVVAAGCDGVIAIQRTTGAQAWRQWAPAPNLPATVPGPMALDGAGRLLVRWPAPVEPSPQRTAVFALSPVDGSVRDAWWFETDAAPLLTDEAGRSLILARAGTHTAVHARALDGTELWRRDEELLPVAAYGPTLFTMTWQGALALDAATGADAYRLPVGPLPWRWERAHVIGPEAGFVLGQQCSATGCAFESGRLPALVTFDPLSGQVRALRLLEGEAQGPLLLTARGSVVFAGEGRNTPELVELDRSGTEAFRCQLARTDPSERFDGPAVLLDGLVVIAGPDGLRGYAVPGLSPASRGWIGERGSAARDGRGR